MMLNISSFLQAFSPAELPSISHLNIRGNPLEHNTICELLELLKGFPSLQSLEVLILEVVISI